MYAELLKNKRQNLNCKKKKAVKKEVERKISARIKYQTQNKIKLGKNNENDNGNKKILELQTSIRVF
jgi:hypothetical protein